MRVAFNKPNEELPLYCDSIGYHWPQPPIQRSNGYYAYHWLQTETGTGIVTINHQRMVLGPKQGVLFRPRIAHDYHPKDGHNWQTAFLSFNGTLCDQLADFLNLKDFIYIDRVSPELASFISESFNDFNSSNVAAMLDQSVELYKFMVLLRQNKLLKNRHYQDQPIAMPIISYISKHYAETISNEQLAKITKYSITYQNRVFKQVYNMTPLAYLNSYRMKKAKALLLTHPTWEIQKISNQVGFRDPSRFIHQFKRFYKTTPAQFRKFM